MEVGSESSTKQWPSKQRTEAFFVSPVGAGTKDKCEEDG